MTDHTLKELMAYCGSMVESLFRKFNVIRPLYLVFLDDDVFIMPAPEVTDKDMAVEMVRAAFAEMRPEAYIYMDEAWLVKSDEKIDDSKSLEGHPDRQEVIHMFIETCAGGSCMAFRNILQRNPPLLGPMEIKENYAIIEGRMCGLLPPPDNIKLN